MEQENSGIGAQGLRLPRFWWRQFSVPELTLQPLNPQMGVGTPSSQGLFPWQRSQGAAPSQWSSWGPAQNLQPPAPLTAERQAAAKRRRQRALLGWLTQLEPTTELDQQHLAELTAAEIPTNGQTLAGEIVKALRPPNLQVAEIHGLPDEDKQLLFQERPDLEKWYLGGL